MIPLSGRTMRRRRMYSHRLTDGWTVGWHRHASVNTAERHSDPQVKMQLSARSSPESWLHFMHRPRGFPPEFGFTSRIRGQKITWKTIGRWWGEPSNQIPVWRFCRLETLYQYRKWLSATLHCLMPLTCNVWNSPFKSAFGFAKRRPEFPVSTRKYQKPAF